MEKTIELKINGRKDSIACGTTVAELLSNIGVNSESVVVEVNLDIIPRPDYIHKTFSAGDVVEILHFVGGG